MMFLTSCHHDVYDRRLSYTAIVEEAGRENIYHAYYVRASPPQAILPRAGVVILYWLDYVAFYS